MEGYQVTRTIQLGDWSYLVDPNPIDSSQEVTSTPHQSSSLKPVTILNTDPQIKNIDCSVIEDTLTTYLSSDDVISKVFFSSLIIIIEEGAGQVVASDIQSKYKNTSVQVRTSLNENLRGPYFLVGDKLHKAYRLFPDTYGAFVSGVLPPSSKSDSSFRESPQIHGIPVPSRLYFSEATSTLPLLGKRIAVKDIYDISGLKTGGGSKAYLSLQEKASNTAAAIQSLIELGAVIIGKTMTSHMVSGVSARDWIDYQCPFNPRGDGYLNPDCSSTGSGAAIVGYEWVDCAIGSDTLGSMVGPASHCGSYGLRPTQGVLSNERALAVSAILDTPGHFARDVETFSLIAKNWIPKSLQGTFGKVTKILVLKDRFAEFQDSESSIMEDFIGSLKFTLKVTKEAFDIESMWITSLPQGADSQSLKEFLSTTLATIQLYDSYQNNLPFRTQYKERFGHEPAIDEIVRYKWNLGSKITRAEYDVARIERETFKTFLEKHVVQEGTLLVLPGGMPWLQYRDEYPGDLEASGKPWQGYGFTTTSFSSLGGLPCVSIPVGQSNYQSKITGREEQKPVSLWILSAPETDNWLIDVIAQVTKSAGRPTSVNVGRTAF